MSAGRPVDESFDWDALLYAARDAMRHAYA